MISWYYVIGSERVGPVSFDALKVLFLNNQINNSTYVWKKGFQNWERIEDVPDLKFTADNLVVQQNKDQFEESIFESSESNQVEEKYEVNTEKIVEQNIEKPREMTKSKIKISPIVELSFSWGQINDIQEIFYVKIGKDRINYPGSDIFGPYSKVELDEALKSHRINLTTLIYSAGMSSWIKIQETPLNQNYYPGINTSIGLNEVPVMLLFHHPEGPMSSIVKRAGVKDCQLLASGLATFLEDKETLATLYLGSEMKVMNIVVHVHKYNKVTQVLDCSFNDMDSEAKKIMLNHAL
jgi:GYF domain 2